MIVARMRELNYGPTAGNDAAGSFTQCANAAVTPSFRRQIMLQSPYFGRPNCEAQLIVITACQRHLPRALHPNRTYKLFRDRHVVEHEINPTPARMRELSRVAHQAIRHVDAGSRIATQAIAERQARRWVQKSLP